FWVDQRLSARDTHDWRTTLLRRLPTLLGRQATVEDMIRILNLPAARACQIATKYGFQHQDQGIALHPLCLLGQHILADGKHLRDGNSQISSSVGSEIYHLHAPPIHIIRTHDTRFALDTTNERVCSIHRQRMSTVSY